MIFGRKRNKKPRVFDGFRARKGGPVLESQGRGDFPAMRVERCPDTNDLLFTLSAPPGYELRTAGAVDDTFRSMRIRACRK